MILHRYLGPKRLSEILDSEFYASPVTGFDDPFEFSFRLEGDPPLEKLVEFSRMRDVSSELRSVMPEPHTDTMDDGALRSYVNRNRETLVQQWRVVIHERLIRGYHGYLARDIRVVCFCDAEGSETSAADEILMWSHYTEGHKGFRITVDLPKELLTEVIYSHKRVALPVPGELSRQEIAEAIRESSKRKSSAWAYEREMRLILSHDRNQGKYQLRRDGDKTYFPFSREWLRAVDIGCNASEETELLIKAALSGCSARVKLQKAFAHQQEFRLLYERVELQNPRSA